MLTGITILFSKIDKILCLTLSNLILLGVIISINLIPNPKDKYFFFAFKCSYITYYTVIFHPILFILYFIGYYFWRTKKLN